MTIAGQNRFYLQGNSSHQFHWKRYGFKLDCPQGAISNDGMIEVTAIVSGLFKFPKGTILVSAVYAITVSKPLLKPLVIKLQHCVDIRHTGQTSCLKFVRAPLKSPHGLQFSIVHGGSFQVGNDYGSIKRDNFCAWGIVVEMNNGNTANGSDNEAQNQGIYII